MAYSFLMSSLNFRFLSLLVLCQVILCFKIKRNTYSPSLCSSTKSVEKEDFQPTVRRARNNKYSTFSKKLKDPLDTAMERMKSIEIEKEESTKLRGTTIPTTFSYPRVQRKTPFSNVTLIDPSDPFSFGYERIGVIVGPHGVKGEVKIHMESDFADFRLKSGSNLYLKRPNRRTPRPITVKDSRKSQEKTYLVSFEKIATRFGAEVFKGFIVYARTEDRPSLQLDEYLIRDLVGMTCHLKPPSTNTDHSLDSESTPSTLLGAIGEVVGVVPPDELCNPSQAALMHSMLEIRLYRPDSHKIAIASKKPVPASLKKRISESELRQMREMDGEVDLDIGLDEDEAEVSTQGDLCLIPLVPQIVTEVRLRDRILVLDPPEGLLSLTYREPPPKQAIRGFLPEVASCSEELRRQLMIWTILL